MEFVSTASYDLLISSRIGGLLGSDVVIVLESPHRVSDSLLPGTTSLDSDVLGSLVLVLLSDGLIDLSLHLALSMSGSGLSGEILILSSSDGLLSSLPSIPGVEFASGQLSELSSGNNCNKSKELHFFVLKLIDSKSLHALLNAKNAESPRF